LFHKGLRDEAFAEYSKTIELDPKDALAWNNRGLVLVGKGLREKAIADWSKAIELDPKCALAWNNRGHAYADLRQWDKALADHNKAVELKPDSASALLSRVRDYAGLGQWDKVIADCNKAIELDPKTAAHWNHRGWAYVNLDQYEKAIADCNRGIELDPKRYWQPWKWRGEAQVKLGRYADAIVSFSRLIDIDPDSATALNNLAWLLATCADPKLRDAGRAVTLARRAVEREPKQASYWNTLGVAQYRAGDWAAAMEALTKSMELGKGGRAEDWFFLAMAHHRRERPKEARQWYEKAVEWMEKNQPVNDELRRFCAEAAELLGMKKNSP
jgi:tetratricopeptide (TPR) repeat protein